MHGLIFETSVWLLAGSTRLLLLKVKHYQKLIWFYLTHPVVIQPIHYQTNSQTVPIPLTNQSNSPYPKTHSFELWPGVSRVNLRDQGHPTHQAKFYNFTKPMLNTLQMSFKPWFQMHSVRKYPIDLTADWTLKQKYPPHIVFWGGGLPFRHPYQFYITFVSKTDFLPQIRGFVLGKHSKLISKPNDGPSFHFRKIFLNDTFLPKEVSGQNFRNLEIWPRTLAQKIFSSTKLRMFLPVILNWFWKNWRGENGFVKDWELQGRWKIFWAEGLGQGVKFLKLWPGSLAQKIFIRKSLGQTQNTLILTTLLIRDL